MIDKELTGLAEREGFELAACDKCLKFREIPCNPLLGADLTVVSIVALGHADLYGSRWK